MYDEFGFLIVNEDNKENNDEGRSNSALCSNVRSSNTELSEDPRNRLQWIAYLEFTYNKDVDDQTWDRLVFRLIPNERLDRLMPAGVPHSLRSAIWLRLSGALLKKQEAGVSYAELVKASSSNSLIVTKQIEKDLLRTLPGNACFSSMTSPGVGRLRRILRAIAYYYPDVGYCQGMGLICAELLLYLEEEDTFWLMCAVLENYLPATYYSGTLIGARADQRALAILISEILPELDKLLAEKDVELSLITLSWFMCIFIGSLPPAQLLHLWDWFLYEGVMSLFRLTLALLEMSQENLVEAPSTAAVFSRLADLPRRIFSQHSGITVTSLLRKGHTLLPDDQIGKVDSLRRKCQAELMRDQGIIISSKHNGNLPRQQLTKRAPPKQGTSAVVSGNFLSSINPFKQHQILASQDQSSSQPADDSRAKNVRQTEILVSLREAVLQVTRHFREKGAIDPERWEAEEEALKAELNVDYSPESHAQDLERFLMGSHDDGDARGRRAIALVDFERQDDDELGFRKNDVITIISWRDEHCWIGELRGLRGWFPAKFVRLLDERGGARYSPAGDDSVDEEIADLIRGLLAAALRSVLTFGLRKQSLVAPVHPWQFIGDVVAKGIASESPAVAPRLVLAQTFSLEDDGRVLTPDELLVKHVTAINLSHDVSSAPMDTRLRSLVCCGLNEQCLHLWLESWCTAREVVSQYYESWSFIRSPAWIQIKCDLRILARLCFHLSRDFELPARDSAYRDFKNGVRDLLVKHHLFSWEL